MLIVGFVVRFHPSACIQNLKVESLIERPLGSITLTTTTVAMQRDSHTST